MKRMLVMACMAIVAGGGLLPAGAAFAPAPAAVAEAGGKLAALMGRYHELGEFNGSVLVARQGRILVNQGFGPADFEQKAANGPDTKFLIGSLTKQFTAAVILKLVETGRLSLDETLAEALPYYRRDTGAKVTVRHLLEHSSGIPCFTRRMQDVQACPTAREFVQSYCSGDLEFEPGSGFRYNNGGYVILGAVIEQATGLSYEEALRRHILSPLGMSDSGLGREGVPLPRAAKGYQRQGGRVVAAGPVDPFLAFSAGGMYSTTRDMARWESAFYGDAVLSAASRALLGSTPARGYFCGQRFRRQAVGPGRAEREVIFHGGRILGFNSLLLRIPQERIFIVLLNNTDSTRLETMAAGLLDALHGRIPRAPRRCLAEEFRVALRSLGIAATLEKLRALRRQEGSLADPEPEEIQLNGFGYELLGQERWPEALAVFSFAVEEFPRSWNAYDSLAEAQATAGLRGQAVANYEKSLELNPENRNAAEQAQKLRQAGAAGPQGRPRG